MKKITVLSLLLCASVSGAQSLPSLPRTTSTTGLNDSALTIISDSALRSRAGTLAQIRKSLSVKAFDSVLTPRITFSGGSTVAGSATWSGLQTFATGQRVDSATGAARASGLVGSPAITVSSCTGCGGGGATVSDTIKNVTFDSVRSIRDRHDTITARAGTSKRLVVQTTTSGGTFTTAVRFNEVQQSLHAAGTAVLPSMSFLGDTTSGLYKLGADTIAVSTGGASYSLFFSGGVNGTITGPTSSAGISIIGGVGAGKTINLNSTSSTGVVKPCLNVNSNVASANIGRITIFGSCGTAGSSLSVPRGRAIGGGIVFADSGLSAAGSDLLNLYVPGTMGGAGADTLALADHVGNRFFSVGGTGSSQVTGGAGNMTIQAGTGNSRTMTLQTTTSAGTAKNVVVLGADSSATFLGLIDAKGLNMNAGNLSVVAGKFWGSNGTAGGPSISFNNSVGTGFYLFGGADTLGISTSGALSLRIAGGATTTLVGGAGSMTIQAGTGNSRTLSLVATNSSGTATPFAVGAGDTLKLPGHLIATGLTAEGSTQSAVCVTNGGGQVFINAAATCTVSSRRFKKNVETLSCTDARRMVAALRPVTYEEKVGGSKRLGIIAEEADSVDHRFASRDAKGQINSTNYEEVFTALLRVQQCGK